MDAGNKTWSDKRMSDPGAFTIPIRVYYEDTDFSGVVYHARYLHFFERGRTEALRSCGVSHTELLGRAEPLAFAVRKMAIEWIAPARIDDVLDVATRFAEIKGARMLIEQEIRRAGALVASADVEAACMNLAGKPRRLPADVAAKLGGAGSP
jgi:acyl-CoA thioester hydrolase